MKTLFVYTIFIFSAIASLAKDVDITQYGAVGDGKTLNTIAIQKAIDACHQGGGGKVIFPTGVFLSGTIVLKDNVTLHLEKNARLLGSTDIEQYRNLDPFTEGLGIDVGWALLVAVDAKNIAITGEGAIDGQGSKLKAEHILKDSRPESERWGRRPFLVRIVRCTGVTVKGVTLNYAAAWTSHYFQSKNIRIENIKIVSVGVAHNDGIGIDGCQHVRIKNCDVVSGDDALVFKTTSSKMACRDIEVTGMRLKSNQAGIKMGTESMAPFENISITNCHIYDTRNGGIKLLTVDGAHLRNVTISDITMDEVRTPMLFRLGSRLKVFRKGQDTQQVTGTFENVTIKNVKVKAADSAQLKPPSGILITGVPGHYITNLTLENIDITLAGGGTSEDAKHSVPEAIDQYPEIKTFGPVIPAYGVWARHVKGLKLNKVRFHLKTPDQRPEFLYEDGSGITIDGRSTPASTGIAVIDRMENEDATSEWVHTNAKGKLEYKTLPAGDRIMDFSYAGYMGGGVAIPHVEVKIVLAANPGDNSDAIQKAIDEVSKMKMVNGFRGAVMLRPGTFDCEKTINIEADGVVLSGSGSAGNGTILNLSGKPHAAISVRGRVVTKEIGDSTIITDKYVPAGARSFHVKNGAVFSVGDTIRITRRITPEWVAFMGMDSLVRDNKKQTWISGDIQTERVIKKIDKHLVTVDVPLNDSYDSKYTGPVAVKKISSTGMLNRIGIENLRIVAPAQSVTINEGHHRAFTLAGLSDGWARNIEIFNTVNSVSVTGRRITVDNISIIHDVPTVGAAKPADLNGSGYQLLFNRCYIKGDNLFFFGTGAKVTGPVVVLNSVFRGNGWIQPHQRWATGLLVDNCEVPDGGIDFMNRGIMGSGHGWTIGWAVAWNCKAKSYLNQMPPGSANWVIGSQGQHAFRAIPFDTIPYLPEGIYDAHNTPVTPASLYLAQLQERLGKQALVNIGYGNNESTDLNTWPAGASPKEVGQRVADRFVATPHTNFNRPTPPRVITYPETCTWYGALTFAKETGNKKLTEQLAQRFEPLFSTRDTLIPKPDHVDYTVFGSVPLELYMQTKEQRYLTLGKNIADKQWGPPEGPRVKPQSHKYYSKGLTWQTRMWIDDMFMITAVQAQAFRATGDETYINRAAREMVVYLDSLQKPNGLFYHAPDVPFFWARGNGWMAVGMSELLRSLPKNNPNYDRIMKGYRLMMSSLLKYQAEDGMWRQLIDDPSSWAETSATGMFTFAFITGVKNGWLDKKAYAPAARKAWLKLITYLDGNADISEVCEGTNKKNDRQYYLDRKRNIGDLHGQAPVLWCATALLRK